MSVYVYNDNEDDRDVSEWNHPDVLAEKQNLRYRVLWLKADTHDEILFRYVMSAMQKDVTSFIQNFFNSMGRMKNNSILKKILTVTAGVLIGISMTAGGFAANEYAVGDTGPGGGQVFYDKGSYTNGWRYLEAAAENVEDLAEWSLDNKSIPGAQKTAIGTGKSNTKAIVDSVANVKRCRIPARLCAEYRGGGKNDWFLPSKDELNEMYIRLQIKGVRHFKEGYYWSSSEDSASKAWIQNFTFGVQNISFKTNFFFRVRPIRAF